MSEWLPEFVAAKCRGELMMTNVEFVIERRLKNKLIMRSIGHAVLFVWLTQLGHAFLILESRISTLGQCWRKPMAVAFHRRRSNQMNVFVNKMVVLYGRKSTDWWLHSLQSVTLLSVTLDILPASSAKRCVAWRATDGELSRFRVNLPAPLSYTTQMKCRYQ